MTAERVSYVPLQVSHIYLAVHCPGPTVITEIEQSDVDKKADLSLVNHNHTHTHKPVARKKDTSTRPKHI